MNNSKPVSTPLEVQLNRPPKNEQEKELKDLRTKYPYCQAVGSLQHLATKTRPDISFAVNYVSRYMQDPTEFDVKNVKRIFRYLQGTREYGLLYPSTRGPNTVCYSDSDFAGSGREGKMKSTSGYIVTIAGGPVAWLAKKQDIVATSVCEAEYISASLCCKELKYLKTLIHELTREEIPAELYVDNQSAIRLIQTGQMHSRTKHIDVRYYSISEKFDKGLFSIKYCPSQKNIADIFTKALPSEPFMKLRKCICNPLS
jgi:hypothetical protein